MSALSIACEVSAVVVLLGAGFVQPALAMVLYVLNPLDLIPDLIFGFGLVDDAGVVALCLKLVESDLHRYAAWKELHSS